ncbi:MAG: AMP-binding protein, partial [Deltaproteobacteria bacterium]
MAGALPTFDIPYTLGAHIEARAGHSATANRVLARHGERSWTYAEYRDHCVRYAHFLLQRLGTVDASRPGHVAVLLENHLEFLAIYGGCAFAGLTLFGINTGLRGETLAGVLNQSGARVLIVDAKFLPQVEQVRQSLKRIAPENVLVYQPPGTTPAAANDLVGCVRSEIGAEDRSLDAPDVTVAPDQNLMVIYTSGTT